MKFNVLQVVKNKLTFVLSKEWSKSLKWQKKITLYKWTLQYIYSHFSFVLFGFAHECEVQESSFDLNYLVLKDNKSNP